MGLVSLSRRDVRLTHQPLDERTSLIVGDDARTNANCQTLHRLTDLIHKLNTSRQVELIGILQPRINLLLRVARLLKNLRLRNTSVELCRCNLPRSLVVVRTSLRPADVDDHFDFQQDSHCKLKRILQRSTVHRLPVLHLLDEWSFLDTQALTRGTIPLRVEAVKRSLGHLRHCPDVELSRLQQRVWICNRERADTLHAMKFNH